jgi:ACS family tartrate transporter-like MFS transporter
MARDQTGAQQDIVRRVWWRLIPLLALICMMNFLDRSNVGFAALDMNGALNFAPHVYGLGITLFFVGYISMMLPSNILVRRIGAKIWLSTLIVGWGIVSTCTALVTDAHGFYVNRLLLGIFEAGFQPGVLFYLTLWFPNRSRALVTSAFMSAGVLIGIVGSPFSAALLDLDGWMGLEGWQWLFVIEGAPSIILGIVAYFYLSSTPKEARWLSSEDKQNLQRAIDDDEPPAAAGQSSVWQVLARTEVQLLTAGYFCIGVAVWTVFFWLPQIVHLMSGGDNLRTGLLTAIPYLVSGIALFAIAHSSDRRNERSWHVAGAVLTGAVGLVLAGVSQNPWLSLTGLCLAAIGVFAFIGPFWALVAAITPPNARAAVIGCVSISGPLGGAVGPMAVGWIRETTGSFSAALFACAVAMVLATLFILLAARQGVRSQRNAAPPQAEARIG